MKKIQEVLNKPVFRSNIGKLLLLVANIASIVLLLPMVKWLRLLNAETLVVYMKLSDESIGMLHYNYGLYDLLSFVQYSGIGKLGIFAMVLFLLIVTYAFFTISFLIKSFVGDKKSKGYLGVLATGKAYGLFGIITGALTMIFATFANKTAGFKLFTFKAAPVVALIIGIISYAVVKIIEAEERAKYGEHGLAREVKKNWILFLMLVPTFIYFMINNYLPMIGAYFGFTNFNFRDGLWSSPYIGFKNFEFLFKADLLKLTRNTILYNVVFIIVGNVLQIFFAILISQVTVKWFKKTSQTLMFMPYFVSFVILKVLVYNIFEYQYGLINNIVTGFGGDRIDFYNTPSYWPVLVTIFYLWKNIGYGMVVYLATITGIDTELYEAAKVDGANIFKQIRYITLPLIKPTFIILLLYALGSIMKGQFELFYQMIGNNGVLYNITDIFDTYVYRITMTQPMSIGLGTAAGLFQSLFGFVIVIVTNWLVKRKNAEYALF